MNILRIIVNSNSNLANPIKIELKENTILEKLKEPTILEKYENKIIELEKKVEEQENIINELRQLLYKQGYLTEQLIQFNTNNK